MPKILEIDTLVFRYGFVIFGRISLPAAEMADLTNAQNELCGRYPTLRSSNLRGSQSCPRKIDSGVPTKNRFRRCRTPRGATQFHCASWTTRSLFLDKERMMILQLLFAGSCAERPQEAGTAHPAGRFRPSCGLNSCVFTRLRQARVNPCPRRKGGHQSRRAGWTILAGV